MKQALFALGLAAALAVTSACGGSSSSPSTTTSNGDGVSNITPLQITDGLVGSGRVEDQCREQQPVGMREFCVDRRGRGIVSAAWWARKMT